LAVGAVDCLPVTLAGVFFLINRSGRFTQEHAYAASLPLLPLGPTMAQ
jgi:hypothetical protein